jgi:hypothetical protein
MMAVGLVAGGKTWWEVLLIYALTSLAGLVGAAFGLLVSAVTTNPISAILVTYICMALCIFPIEGASAFFAHYSSFGGPASVRPAFTTFSFQLFELAGETMPIMGWAMPYWVVNLLASGLFVWFFIACAGSALMPASIPLARSARISLLVFSTVVATMLGVASSTNRGPISDWIMGYVVPIAAAFCLVFVPAITSCGFDASRRFLPDGLFKLANTLKGKPSGNLPFLLLLTSLCSSGLIAGIGLTMDAGESWADLANLNLVSALALGLAIALATYMVGVSASLYTLRVMSGHVAAFFYALTLVLLVPLFKETVIHPAVVPFGSYNGQQTWLEHPLNHIDPYAAVFSRTPMHGVIWTHVVLQLGVFFVFAAISKRRMLRHQGLIAHVEVPS